MSELAKRLRDAREAAGVSQTAWAQRLGVTQTAVSYWEAGKREPPLTVLCRYSEGFGLSLDYLIAGRKDGHFRGGFRAGVVAARSAVEAVAVDAFREDAAQIADGAAWLEECFPTRRASGEG